MKVKFRVNLGSIDAARINKRHGVSLSAQACREGAEVDVRDEAAEALIECGVASRVDDEPVVRGQAKKAEVTGQPK